MQFLEIILPFVKENPVHGIVFVVNASRRLSAELKLCVQAIKECFNGMLRESRLIIHVNKLPNDLEFEQMLPDIDDLSMRKIRSQKVNLINQFLAVISLSEDQAKNFANKNMEPPGEPRRRLTVECGDLCLAEQTHGGERIPHLDPVQRSLLSGWSICRRQH